MHFGWGNVGGTAPDRRIKGIAGGRADAAAIGGGICAGDRKFGRARVAVWGALTESVVE